MSYLGMYRPFIPSSINSDLVPLNDDTISVGSSNKRFKRVHVTTLESTDTISAAGYVVPGQTGFLTADGGVAPGSGDLVYSGGTGVVGQHYKMASTDGKTLTKSDIVEDATTVTFGGQDLKNVNSIEVSNSTDTVTITPSQISTAPTKNLTFLSGNFLNLYGESITASATNSININSDFVNINTGNMMINSDTIITDSNITANSFIKAGSTNQQYLMGDGSVLQQSAVSGNSNFYLYTNIPFGLIPAIGNGYVSYNNAIQKDATIIYIHTITRDDISIQVYMQQIGLLNDIYIQAQAGTDFIRYNIKAEPQFIDSYLQVNVEATDWKGTGETNFGNDTQLLVSFFSNLTEIDERISGVESKTLNLTAVATNTTLTNDLTLDNTIIKGNVNIENNKISFGGYNIGTLNNISNNVVFGNNAGTTSNLCQNNILIGQNVGSALVNGSDNIGIGDGAVYLANGSKNIHIGTIAGISTKADNNICIGFRAGYGYVDVTGSNNIFMGEFCNASNALITNSINIGSFITATNSNEIIIGNSANDNLKMGNSNGFFTGKFRTTGGTSSQFLKADGSIDNNSYVTPTSILNITNSATIFYNGATQSSSNNSFISTSSSPAALALVGGLPTQVTQGTASTKDKIFKTLFPESSVASFQDSGLLGSTNFLLNSQALYVGMGWNIKISFGIADTFNSNGLPSPAGMFVGLVSQNAINWSGSITPTFLLSCIGVGHGYLDSFISIYHKGSISGTATATTWGTATPDATRWFHLTLTNLFNSNDVILTLTETISNVSVTQTFTCGTGTASLATNIRLYPCIQRIIGNSAPSGSGRIHLGQFTFNQLI